VGTALSFLGRLDEATPFYEQALQVYGTIGLWYDEGHAQHNLAWLHWDQGRLEAAEAGFLRALALWERADFRRGIAIIHNDLGTLYLDRGRWREARDHLRESAQRFEVLGITSFLPEAYEAYAALARAHLALGQSHDALAAAQKALNQARRNGDRLQEVTALRVLGEAHLADAAGAPEPAEALATAMSYAQQSLDLAQAEPPLTDQADATAELLEKIRQAQVLDS
jgi:tetratricopeptide (TPR) repeat protein